LGGRMDWWAGLVQVDSQAGGGDRCGGTGLGQIDGDGFGARQVGGQVERQEFGADRRARQWGVAAVVHGSGGLGDSTGRGCRAAGFTV